MYRDPRKKATPCPIELSGRVPLYCAMTKTDQDVRELIDHLRSLGSERNRAGMARFGITVTQAFGVSIPPLRALARRLGRDHLLAAGLWNSGWHEARLLAVYCEEIARVDRTQMEAWAADFNSWDLTDQTCSNLFIQTPFAMEKVHAWAAREEEFVRRAAFAMLAALAVHSRTMEDADFRAVLPLLDAAADDERNFVRKSVNWALRQIGKRTLALHADALAFAETLTQRPSRSARWIARDAIRELSRPETINRIETRRAKRPVSVHRVPTHTPSR